MPTENTASHIIETYFLPKAATNPLPDQDDLCAYSDVINIPTMITFQQSGYLFHWDLK